MTTPRSFLRRLKRRFVDYGTQPGSVYWLRLLVRKLMELRTDRLVVWEMTQWLEDEQQGETRACALRG